MSTFVEHQWLDTVLCCECGILFAMPADYRQRRLKDHAWFFCPSGHKQQYTGPTEETRLKQQLEREAQMREAAEARAGTAERNLAEVTRAHRKMRDRVMNGVCPCCNRSFSNLREHMKSEHFDFGTTKTLFALRQAFGMTQDAVAREAGVFGTHVSLYERNKPVAAYAKRRLDLWIGQHSSHDSTPIKEQP